MKAVSTGFDIPIWILNVPKSVSHIWFQLLATHQFSVFEEYSADLNYPDKTYKTWIFKRVFLKLG